VDESVKITAQDIRHQEFMIKFRGYDKTEVDQFLNQVADYLEQDSSSRNELKQKLKLLEDQVSEFKNLEQTLKDSLIRSQESADELKRNTEKEAELIIREAQVKGDRMIEERRSKIDKLENSYEALRTKRNEYFVRFKSLLLAHLELLEKLEKEYENMTGGEVSEKTSQPWNE